MNSEVGGNYPGPEITIGPGLGISWRCRSPYCSKQIVQIDGLRFIDCSASRPSAYLGGNLLAFRCNRGRQAAFNGIEEQGSPSRLAQRLLSILDRL